MVKKIKKYLLLLLTVAVFSGAVPVSVDAMQRILGSADLTGTEDAVVYDNASLLTSEEALSLEADIKALEQTTGWEIFAVSTGDAGGKTAMAYADDFFDAHTDVDADGVVLLIDMDNREIYISTCGAAIRYLDDNRLDNILDEAYEYVLDAEYADCFREMLCGIEYYYQKGIPEGQYNYDTETGKVSVYHKLTVSEIFVTLLVAIGVGLLIYFSVVGKYRLKFGTYKYDFHRYGKIQLTNKEDRFLNKTVTHRVIATQNNGSGSSHHSSGHRSSTHHSSSGRSHGGRGRKF